jgi:hypothetical protein
MNPRLLLAGILVMVLVAVGSLQLASITGFISTGESPSVEVTIDYGTETLTYNVDIGSRESVLDALIRVATVDYKTYGELGASITGINGVSNDKNRYWLCLVNGEIPPVACSAYYPINGDVITFRYLTTEEAEAYF